LHKGEGFWAHLFATIVQMNLVNFFQHGGLRTKLIFRVVTKAGENRELFDENIR